MKANIHLTDSDLIKIMAGELYEIYPNNEPVPDVVCKILCGIRDKFREWDKSYQVFKLYQAHVNEIEFKDFIENALHSIPEFEEFGLSRREYFDKHHDKTCFFTNNETDRWLLGSIAMPVDTPIDHDIAAATVTKYVWVDEGVDLEAYVQNVRAAVEHSCSCDCDK